MKRSWIETFSESLGLISKISDRPDWSEDQIMEGPKELYKYPDPSEWNDFTELDAKAYPEKKERHYSIVPTTCFNCESACGLLAYVDKESNDVRKFEGKYDFKVFNEPFLNENEAIATLEEFEALFIMRERTAITKSLISALPKLKYIMTSGMRNNAIDFDATKEKKIIPGKIQLIAEMLYNFVAKMISDTAGSKAKPYFPFIFSLFMFVLLCNMVGMLPYAFTVTSHIIVTLIMALFIFIAVTIIGFLKHGFKYLSIFVPSGVPAVLLPLITIIEIISYLSRPVSLSVRLFANMMAGHTMLKVFGGFVISLGILGGWLPLSFSVALTGLEILVAFLQAYVFAILTCIYLNDALNLHH